MKMQITLKETPQFTISRQTNIHFELVAIRPEGHQVANEFEVRSFINDQRPEFVIGSPSFSEILDAVKYFDLVTSNAAEQAIEYKAQRAQAISDRLLG